jgi:hypothetical protein
MGTMSDLTLKVLKGIREDLAELRTEIGKARTELKGEIGGLRTELRDFKVEVRHGFAAVNQRLDNVLLFTGTHYQSLDRRLTALEDKDR